ncbi:hypothetical protein E2C01_076408 [Portunus trituberculatus]|uniref:Uncharacterized protein n=1 Tax=Portunus trituberculatus TaxID=210409 RepID=A0A5B7ING7_PORTR|nr:hypothetical protein [Portunus trituberculatus]
MQDVRKDLRSLSLVVVSLVSPPQHEGAMCVTWLRKGVLLTALCLMHPPFERLGGPLPFVLVTSRVQAAPRARYTPPLFPPDRFSYMDTSWGGECLTCFSVPIFH